MIDQQELDASARALYNQCQTVKPAWEQLGEVTKNVWRERVLPAPKTEVRVPPGHMESLF